MKFGVQLFGARELFASDPAKFIEGVAKLGYSYIEPCLVSDALPAQFASTLWGLDKVSEYMKMMEANGLSMISCHAFGLEERMVELYEKYGVPHFVIHCGNVAEDYERRADFIARLADDLHSAGAELWLHNGAGDCVPGKVGDLSYYEAIIDRSPYVKAEFDNGWGLMDHADQYAIMERLGDRLGCLHLKEMGKNWEGKPMEQRFALPGEGMSDFNRLLELNGGRDIILDEDYPVIDWFTDYARTIEYLKG